MMLRYCANLKAIRYESTSLNRIVADKSHRVIVASEEKCSSETMMVIVMVIHYSQSVLEHGLPPSLNLNHNTYSTLPRIHVRRESMARGTKEHLNVTRL